MIPYKQLSLADIFTDCQNKFDNDKYKFLSILDETINLDEIVPVSFVSHFHAATGRPRIHQLYPMLRVLLLQLIFSIPTTSLLIVFLKYSQELRNENPCTESSCGRMFYIYPEKNLRAYPRTIRGTDEWNSTYKIRVAVEKSINYFKYSFCVAGRKTQNEKTLHADLSLAGITQFITVLVADKIHKHQYIRSLKPLIA